MAITELRKEIDEIYDEMLALFIRQAELTAEIGRVKANEGKTITDRKREEEILEKAAANSPQIMQNYSIEFFREVMKLAKQYYEDVK
ncbi:MAG: chorismate mutase [Oscillospiraceae bacterium]|nr:chorismate mutase [Oscillospiraceae bacterium]